jgi:hypothetical protein
MYQAWGCLVLFVFQIVAVNVARVVLVRGLPELFTFRKPSVVVCKDEGDVLRGKYRSVTVASSLGTCPTYDAVGLASSVAGEAGAGLASARVFSVQVGVDVGNL